MTKISPKFDESSPINDENSPKDDELSPKNDENKLSYITYFMGVTISFSQGV